MPGESYEVGSQLQEMDAILVRSHKLHDMELPDTLLAVARAGAGVNNKPVEMLSKRGIPVFNAPGAKANAVKEWVLGAIRMAAARMSFSVGINGSILARRREFRRGGEEPS